MTSKEKSRHKPKFNKNSHLFCALILFNFLTLYSYSYWWCSVSNQFIHTRPDKGNREIQIARTRTEEEEDEK